MVITRLRARVLTPVMTVTSYCHPCRPSGGPMTSPSAHLLHAEGLAVSLPAAPDLGILGPRLFKPQQARL